MSPGTAPHPPGRDVDTDAMKTVTVAEAKAGIARLLKLVRQGETVVVMSRGKAVAEIRPAGGPSVAEPSVPLWSEHALELARKGVIILPDKKLDLDRIRAARAKLPKGMGVLDALLAEREENR